MPSVDVHKAQRTIRSDDPIDDRVIRIGGELGEAPDQITLNEASYLFQREAWAIAEALRAALPGGTLDHLTSILLQFKIGHLRVSSAPQPDNSPEARERQNYACLKLLEGRVPAAGIAAIEALRAILPLREPGR